MTDGYFGPKIAGGYTKSGEAPYIIYDPVSNYYYLYVTYGWLGVDGGYHVRMYRFRRIDGTYNDAAGNVATFSSGTNQADRDIKVFGNYKFSTRSTGYSLSDLQPLELVHIIFILLTVESMYTISALHTNLYIATLQKRGLQ